MTFIGLLLDTGCAKQPPAVPVAPAGQSQNIEHLSKRIFDLQREVWRLRGRTARYDSVLLDPTEKGYGRIDTSSGFFLVSVASVEPYLDGYRLHLKIGNPTSARYEGFKLTLTWQQPMPDQRQGESDDEFSKRFDDWSKVEPREKEMSFTETLHPASWNSITMVVSPATADEIKNLQISSMETSRVLLNAR